jgi:hypothetical protein
MDLLKAAHSLNKYKKVIRHFDKKELRGKITHEVNGERVLFTKKELEEIKLQSIYLVENDLNGETFWTNKEIHEIAEQIEILEDDGEDTSALRNYRKELRAYLADANFPTCERPVKP